MPVIYPTDQKTGLGATYPDGAVDATELARIEPLLTPDLLISRHLFGIPLVSHTPDPITHKKMVMTPDMLKDHIYRAISKIELEGGFYITPVAKQGRYQFDRVNYLSFGFLQLNDRPISSIQSFDIITAQGNSVYRVPNEWIAPGHLHRGQLSFIPLQPAFLGSGYLPSASAGGAAFISILGQRNFVPEYWQVSYICGFEEGKIPKIVNELIGSVAAIEILALLQATHLSSSHSIGVDGLSQSISTQGPQIYQAQIELLKEKQKVITKKLKVLFGLVFFSDSL